MWMNDTNVKRCLRGVFLASAIGGSSAIALAQGTAGGQTKPKPAAKPAPAPPPAAPAPAKAASTAKGFSRVTVTPTYKEEFQTEIKVAVVAAPSYRGSGLNPLRYTFVDALDLKSELERQGYKVILVAPSDATADNIRKALQDSKQLLDGTNQGTLLFAFSGHGFQTTKGNYLVTVGVTADLVEKEALPLNEVQSLMNASGARRKVVLVDACRNDPDAKSADGPRTFAQFQEAEGTSVLLSTRPGGFSYEDADLAHGIFTHYVLEGLRGKAAGKDGYVTFFDLQKFVEDGVMTYALKKDKVQRPFVLGERSGDFLLATAAPPKPGDIPPAPAASTTLDSNALVLREVGGGRSFFALLNGTKLTLVDSKSLSPFVELTDTAANDVADGYRHFRGNAANSDLYDAAVETKGTDIVGLKGRIGKACPKETACSTPTQVPLLPGEKVDEARSKTKAVANTASAAKNGLAKLGIGGGAKNAGKTQVGAETAGVAMDSNNPLLKYQWKVFDLTTNLPKK